MYLLTLYTALLFGMLYCVPHTRELWSVVSRERISERQRESERVWEEIVCMCVSLH